MDDAALPRLASLFHDDSLLVYTSEGRTFERGARTVKLAFFDLDETIITTKSQRKFPVSGDDWRFKYPRTTATLQRYQRRGYLIVIVSNQLGISKGMISREEFGRKTAQIFARLGVPAMLFAATRSDKYRKPSIGVWRYLLETVLGVDEARVDAASFFCGDSAGRARGDGDRDHSSCDLLFALNCGLRFYLPENVFYDDSEESIALLSHTHKMVLRDEFLRRFVAPLRSFDRICVLIMGPPKSGKSVVAGFFADFVNLRAEELVAPDRAVPALPRGAFRVVVECSSTQHKCPAEVLRAVKALDVFAVCFYLRYDYELMKEVYYHANYNGKAVPASFPTPSAEYSRPARDIRNAAFNSTFEISYFAPSFGEPCPAG